MKYIRKISLISFLCLVLTSVIVIPCNAETYYINVSNGSKKEVATALLNNNWTWSSNRVNYDTALTVRMVNVLQETVASVSHTVKNVSICWSTTFGSESYPIFTVVCRVPKTLQLTTAVDANGDGYVYTYTGNNYDVPSELYIVGGQTGAKELVCRFYMPYYINNGNGYQEVLKHNAPIAYYCAQSGYGADYWDIGYMIDLQLMWDYIALNKGVYMLKGNIPLSDGTSISTFDMDTLNSCISPIINFAYDLWKPGDAWSADRASWFNSQFHSYFLPGDTDVTMYSNFNFYIPAEERLTDELISKILVGEIGITDNIAGLSVLTQEELEALKNKYIVPNYPIVDIDNLSQVFNWADFMQVFNNLWNTYQSNILVYSITSLFFSFVTILLILKVRR